MSTKREQALAAVDRMVGIVKLAWDVTDPQFEQDAGVVRGALTLLSDPGLQTMVDRADDVREAGFPVLADDVDNVLFELMDYRARPTLTAEEARALLGNDEGPSGRRAFDKLRAIAEVASGE